MIIFIRMKMNSKVQCQPWRISPITPYYNIIFILLINILIIIILIRILTIHYIANTECLSFKHTINSIIHKARQDDPLKRATYRLYKQLKRNLNKWYVISSTSFFKLTHNTREFFIHKCIHYSNYLSDTY